MLLAVSVLGVVVGLGTSWLLPHYNQATTVLQVLLLGQDHAHVPLYLTPLQVPNYPGNGPSMLV